MEASNSEGLISLGSHDPFDNGALNLSVLTYEDKDNDDEP